MYKIPFVDERLIQNYYNLVGNNGVFSVFIGENVSYTLKTDGIIEEKDTRIDKWPYHRDILLKDCGTLKRCDFIINEANIVLIQKKIFDSHIQDFYFNNEYIKTFLKQKGFIYSEIDFNEKEKIRVKSLKFEI